MTYKIGTITVKFKPKGYEEKSITVGINVKPAAPSFGGGEGGSGGGGAISDEDLGIFDASANNVPYGYIRFNYDSFSDGKGFKLDAYEYCTDSAVTESSVWSPIIKNASDSEFPGTYDKKKTDGTLFATDGTFSRIYMRYRKRAHYKYDETNKDYVYYSFAKQYWVDKNDDPIYQADGETKIFTDEELLDSGNYENITENSDAVVIELGHCVGSYRESVSSILVHTDGDVVVNTHGKGLLVEGYDGQYVSFAWYIEDSTTPAQTGINAYFELPSEYTLSDKYVVRVEATDKLGEIYTATITITIAKN